ncbi:MAG TPA: 2Fe-2S iron-sulfur cluster-binding protein [Acidimicrobiales bacterium]|nr:2Fe-2S iron-sulfur cluster-binding protein [Acidimicrobiales bacterium]
MTPVRRVAGRAVTTVDGLPADVRQAWVDAFVAAGASQCGFCTPGIVMRLAALANRPNRPPADEAAVRTALLAHLCRCTGWQTVVEAAGAVLGTDPGVGPGSVPGDEPAIPTAIPTATSPATSTATSTLGPARDPLLAAWRAQLEGPMFQSAGAGTVLGRAGFADDTAPPGAVVAVPDATGGLAVAGTLAEARRSSGKVQGRNSTVPLAHPVAPPPGDWVLSLQTTWVEPAYLEPDASWCVPGGRPASPLANGGAFGGKRRSPVPEAATALAGELGRPVRVLWSREDVVRRGPKRPPVAVGVRADGTGVLRVARSGSDDLEGLADRVARAAPGLAVELVDVPGPPTSADLRGAGWAEAAVVTAVLGALAGGHAGPGTPAEVTGPSGGRARVTVAEDGTVSAEVWAGEVLDPVTLRSYCVGAVHQALGWVRSEGIAVDPAGAVHDLTIRSFGILSARDTPHVDVTVHPSDRWPVNGSDAVFAATAAAAWLADGLPPAWPTRRGPAAGTGAAR